MSLRWVCQFITSEEQLIHHQVLWASSSPVLLRRRDGVIWSRSVGEGASSAALSLCASCSCPVSLGVSWAEG